MIQISCLGDLLKNKIFLYILWFSTGIDLYILLYNLFRIQVSMQIFVLIPLLPQKQMTSFHLKRMMSLVGLLDTVLKHMLFFFFFLLWFNLPVYPQYQILGSQSNIHFVSVAALHVSLPSAQSSDWSYLLKYSESRIANFLYGTHNDRTENGKTYQDDVYFLLFQDNAVFGICQCFVQFLWLS